MSVNFICNWRACSLAGQNRVLVQECLHNRVINKFIKVKNSGFYCICRSIDHSGRIKMSSCVSKSCFNQRVMKNAKLTLSIVLFSKKILQMFLSVLFLRHLCFPAPGRGPIFQPHFVFDSSGSKFVFHGPSSQPVFACSSFYN